MQADDAAVLAFGLDGDGLEQMTGAGDFSFEWNIYIATCLLHSITDL